MFARAFSSLSCLSLTGLLVLGCGDNPSGEGDEVASSSESSSSSSESGSAGSETSASAGSSEATQTGSESSTSEGSTTQESTSESDSTDTTSETTGETGDPMPIGQCVDDCRQPADCASGDPAFNADNWECQAGACKWLGCSSNNECNPGFVCHDPGIGVSSCVADCNAPSDCSQNFGPFITSNYACDVGACVYLGCADDSECDAIGPGYVCSGATWPVPTCVPPCFDASECASPMPAYDFDNWSCEDGGCVWLGCKDGECGKAKVCLLE